MKYRRQPFRQQFLWCVIVWLTLGVVIQNHSTLFRSCVSVAGPRDKDDGSRRGENDILEYNESSRMMASTVISSSSSHSLNSTPAPKKPHLVFHVGVPKTGTTSLQTLLTQLKGPLALDNYTYAGRYYHPALVEGNKTVLHRNWTELHQYGRNMLKRRYCKAVDRTWCVDDFATTLREDYAGRNVLLSDESWGPQAWKTPEDYHAIQKSLGDEWEITIVVGYRPFFQWIRSDLFQRHRLDMLSPWKNAWPASDGNGAIPWLFPNYFHYDQWFVQYKHRFTDYVLDNAQDQVDHVHVLPMTTAHSNASLLTRFVCDILPDAPRTCRATRDKNDLSQSVHNSGDKAVGIHFYHDQIATAAAGSAALIDKKQYSRSMVRQALANAFSSSDYPLKCPTLHQLEQLWQMSADLEVKCLFAIQPNTRRAFDDDVAAGVFCTVDTDAVLRNDTQYYQFLVSHFSTKIS